MVKQMNSLIKKVLFLQTKKVQVKTNKVSGAKYC